MSEPPMTFRAGTRDITVNIPDRAALEAEVTARLRAGRGFALATLNLDHLAKLGRDPGFGSVYAAQDLVVADGNPVVWLSRLAARPVALVPGSDMVIPLAQWAAAAGAPVALVGSTDAVLARARAAIEAAAPGVTIAATIAPPMGFDPDGPEGDAVLDALQASGARLCLLALGAPRQEALAARGRRRAPELGFASIGAGLDFLAGAQRRAPRLVRMLALEWLWRMLGNPRRLALRYARCAALLPRLTLDAWRLRRDHAAAVRAG